MHGRNIPLTYKFNLKKTPAVPKNAYKRETIMTEKSFTVDWLIKDFGPKV